MRVFAVEETVGIGFAEIEPGLQGTGAVCEIVVEH